MMTLGARGWPSLEGVPKPTVPTLPLPLLPAWPCCAPNCGPAARDPEGGAWPGGTDPPGPGGASTAGWILFRASVSWVCDDEGVPVAEPEGELEAPREGDAVPEDESFFLDDLPSLLRESCSD